MKQKNIILIASIVAVLALMAVLLVIFLPSEENTTDPSGAGTPLALNDIIGETLSLQSSVACFYELSNVDLSDEISQAILENSTVRVESIDRQTMTASVEFRIPDIEAILKSIVLSDDGDDFDAMFEQFCERVNAAIKTCDEESKLTVTAECPVMTESGKETISIAGVSLLNYEEILVDILLEMVAAGGVSE